MNSNEYNDFIETLSQIIKKSLEVLSKEKYLEKEMKFDDEGGKSSNIC